jgi:predicted aldo/keto reductase-like oxidoreductase
MEYRRFGQTELRLSVFSLGTMRCLASAAIYQATLEKALELGINHLETAPAYGNSELYLSQTLPTIPRAREDIYITTKILPQQLSLGVEPSLQRLGLEYIDCLAIHGINTPAHLELTLNNIHILQKAQVQGKIKCIGFSTHGSLELILAALATKLFSFVNLHYYYFFQRHEEAISLAHAQDMGIFIISPADKGGKLHNPPPNLKNLCTPLSPLAFNYRFLLADARITTLSLGAANPEELLTPLASLETDAPLTPIQERLETHLDNSLGSDRCLQCYQCLPCPAAIPIPEVLRLRNLAVGLGMLEYGQYRYQMLENAGHWFSGNQGNKCTECGDCLPRCPENLDIPRLLFDTHERLQGSPRRRLWQD